MKITDWIKNNLTKILNVIVFSLFVFYTIRWSILSDFSLGSHIPHWFIYLIYTLIFPVAPLVIFTIIIILEYKILTNYDVSSIWVDISSMIGLTITIIFMIFVEITTLGLYIWTAIFTANIVIMREIVRSYDQRTINDDIAIFFLLCCYNGLLGVISLILLTRGTGILILSNFMIIFGPSLYRFLFFFNKRSDI
jgi:hypothetical protein